MSDDIRQYIHLVETYITQPKVLNIELTPYDFSTLMKEYRATDPTYNKIGNNAMAAFYTEVEREDFKQFLRKNNVKFSEVDDEYKDGLS